MFDLQWLPIYGGKKSRGEKSTEPRQVDTIAVHRQGRSVVATGRRPAKGEKKMKTNTVLLIKA